MPNPKERESFEFDAALSFAGQDRRHAEALKDALQKLGRRVFYDRDHTAHLWGKRQSEYEQIYGPRSRYVLPIVSAAYPNREWTQLELAYAKREAERRDSDFILPVRLDDTVVLGLPDDLNYISLAEQTAEQIASQLDRKIRDEDWNSTPAASKQSTDAIALLSDEVRVVVHLIGAGIWPLNENTYGQLFPDVQWSYVLPKLRAAGVLNSDSESLQLSKSARSAIITASGNVERAYIQWIGALESQSGHVDLTYLLGYYYLVTGRHDESARLLADMAGSGDLGHWSQIYLDFLETYADSKHWRKFDGDLRCEILNAIARCQISLGSSEAAKHTLARLLTFSRRSKNNYWTGQTLLTMGARAAHEEDSSEARKWYELAVAHGEKHNDQRLLGRVFGNLSQLEIDDNPIAAQLLLEQSLRHKRATKDNGGIAFASAQAGTLSARVGDYRAAASHYREACKLMGELGMEYDHATTLIHLAQALLDSGQAKRAVPQLKASIEIATVWTYDTIHRLALGYLGKAHFELGNWDECRDAFQQLLSAARGKDVVSQVCARHGIALVELRKGHRVPGLRLLNAALRVADRAELREWSVRCRVDRRRSATADNLGEPDIGVLLSDSRKLEKRSRLRLAADLLNWVGEHCIDREGYESEAVHGLSEAFRLYKLAGESEDAVFAMAKIAEANERQGNLASALTSLEQAETLASSQGLKVLGGQLANQRGTLLLDLQRGDEANNALQRALRVAKQSKNTLHVIHALHNLGEAYRRSSKYEKASQSLRLAETTAQEAGDIASAIDSRHSRALVEQHQERFEEASKLLQLCRKDAKKHSLWGEYVRAWEAMANLAWHRGDVSTAEKRYARALDEARQRKQLDSAHRTALNYASLLHYRDKSKNAKKILAPHAKRFSRSRNAYLYHAKLGAIAFECNDLDLALEQCRLGIESADAAENREYQATCRGFLGEVLVSSGRYREAAPHLEKAIDFEEVVEDEVQLRYALITAYLGCGREGEIQPIFDELVRLALENEMWESLVDVHMLLFDHNWAEGWEARLDAMKAYAMAFFYAADGELLEGIAHLALYLIAKLTASSKPLSANKLADLQGKFGAWIEDSTSESDSLGAIILTLMHIAEELQQFVGRPRVLQRESERQLTDFWRNFDID